MEHLIWLFASSVLALVTSTVKGSVNDSLCDTHSAELEVCADYSACYLPSQKCDGTLQCNDHSDEVDCESISWLDRNMWNIIIILPIILIGVCAVIAGLCACIRLKRRRDMDIAKSDEEGQHLQGIEGGSTNPLDKPEGFTLAKDGNSLWAGHPEYFYND